MQKMNSQIKNALSDFLAVVKKEVDSSVVAVRVFSSNAETIVEFETKDAATLKSDGISMKNLRGEWIK
jgi:hypothetical protein